MDSDGQPSIAFVLAVDRCQSVRCMPNGDLREFVTPAATGSCRVTDRGNSTWRVAPRAKNRSPSSAEKYAVFPLLSHANWVPNPGQSTIKCIDGPRGSVRIRGTDRAELEQAMVRTTVGM